MYLATLTISNFRKLKHVEMEFQPGLNVLVGANNVGKTAVVDALRALLGGTDSPYLRLRSEDLHRPVNGEAGKSITFTYVFRDLSLDDEADFLTALRPRPDGTLEAVISVRFTDPDSGGALRVRRWAGEHEDVLLTSEMMENLRGVYLQPLRDAAKSLRPSKSSQLSRLMQLLADEAGRIGIDEQLAKLDISLKEQDPLRDTQHAITSRHKAMLGPQLAQVLEVGLSASDFQRLAARLSITVDLFDIEMNGLGFNNLIFMAVVLSELIKNPDSAYRCLIVEEPEAHLHPQLQSVLLRYLEKIQKSEGENEVQVFVTSHSPNFASIAKLDTIACLVEVESSIDTFFPRQVSFDPGKREKLERYLDVTRAELFFARRIVFVEGVSELMLVRVLAERAGYSLREHGVSLISVEGLNFDSFLPLFGSKALRIPVAIMTDADPSKEEDDKGEIVPLYPRAGEAVTVSANTAAMKKREDEFVKVFHGVKTIEYDLALMPGMRSLMLKALEELHPKIARSLAAEVDDSAGDAEKAKVLYKGMFERVHMNVQKGKFGQALAAQISESLVPIAPPAYLLEAIKYACQKG